MTQVKTADDDQGEWAGPQIGLVPRNVLGYSPRFRAECGQGGEKAMSILTFRPAPTLPAEAASSPAFRLTHRPALDGLRGCAILAVMLCHTAPPAAPAGFLGVDVFFVLSGFLITALLLQEWQRTGGISLRHFYLRRVLRLLPALVAFLLVSWLYARLAGSAVDEKLTRHGAVPILLYYFNWQVAYRMAPYYLVLHTWSLSVEEQFYLVWPLALLLLLRCRVPRAAVVGLLLAGVVAVAVERFRFCVIRVPIERVYFGTDTRADALLAGCLVGLLASWGWLPRAGWPRAALRGAGWAAVLVLLAHGRSSVGDAYIYRGGFTVVALATAVLIAALVQSPPRLLDRALGLPPLAWVGRVSYGLYLWHVIVFWHLIPRLLAYIAAHGVFRSSFSPLLVGLLEFPAALGVAALSFYLIEQPFLRLKDRLGRPAAPGPRPSAVQLPESAKPQRSAAA